MSMRRYIDIVNEASRDPLENPQFRQWFAGSKCVDGSGKPLLVYHGTEASFHLYNNWPICFTPDPQIASAYALGSRIEYEKSLPNVRAAYLRILQPRVFTERSLSLLIDNADGERQWDVLENYAAGWERSGADGVYLQNVLDYAGMLDSGSSTKRHYDQWWVFRNSQIWPLFANEPLEDSVEPEVPDPDDKY